MGVTHSAPAAGVGRGMALLKAVRPAEWAKNLFVLAPLVFSGEFDSTSSLGSAALAFVAFCAMAGAGYLVNDLVDADLDRRHALKRRRPIASGALGRPEAAAAAAVLAVTGVALGLAVTPAVGATVAGYGALTVLYTLLLKRLVIIDVMTIGALFLLRVLAGGLAVDVPVSEWLLVCTGALALFLGFAKRRQEAAAELRAGTGSRPVLEHYSLPFLDQMVSMVTAVTVISYVIYTLDSPLVGDQMLATVPPVLYGVFRYLYLIYDRGDQRGTAELVTHDPGMLLAGVAWAGVAGALIYLG